jgi:hypothetical protein
MSLLTRDQFQALWNSHKFGLGDDDGPLWIPEQITGSKCQYFLSIPPIVNSEYTKFLHWCHEHCRGRVLCFAIDDIHSVAWYGFTCVDDIPWFALRWSSV